MADFLSSVVELLFPVGDLVMGRQRSCLVDHGVEAVVFVGRVVHSPDGTIGFYH